MRASDLDFVRRARAHGWISAEACESVLAEADRLQALGLEKGVDDVLLERRLLDAERVHSLREELGWAFRSPRLGDYLLIRRIGVGGSGVVFEARHVRLKQRVALKVLLPRLASMPEVRDRFLREATALARLNHPHLVHAIDAGVDGEHCFLALEFVDGENAQQLVARSGPVEPWRSIRLVTAVARALAVLEENGLLHCDVKPANVILEEKGGVRLVDLGLATELGDGSGQAALYGSPHYMAPERVARLGRIDSRSDLYSLAATWFHLVAGRPPFVGQTTRAILEAQAKSPVPAVRDVAPDVPERMARTIERWLAKDPAMRPADCAAALHELRVLEASRPEEKAAARLPSRSAPRGGARRLRPAVLALLAVTGTLGMLGALVVVASVMRGRSTTEEERPRPVTRSAAEDPIGPAAMHAAGADAGAPAAETASGVEPSREAFAAPPPESPRAEEPGAAAAAAASAREEREERPRREDASSASASTPRAPSVGPSAEPPRDSPEGGAAPGPAAGAASRASSGEAAAADSEIGASELPPPGPLAASFAASEARVAPPGDRSFTVDLRYAFASPRELDDFRSRRAWLVEDGRLLHRSAVDAQLESVAWFRLPLSATLELARPAVVALGFASLRVAPGDGESALLWAAGDGPDIDAPDDARRALPLASGVVHVVFFAEGVRITSGETEATFDVPVPKNGRFVVELPPGGELLSLRLEGALSEAWAEERVRLLESLPGGAAGGASED